MLKRKSVKACDDELTTIIFRFLFPPIRQIHVKDNDLHDKTQQKAVESFFFWQKKYSVKRANVVTHQKKKKKIVIVEPTIRNLYDSHES